MEGTTFMACIHGSPKIVLYANGVLTTKKEVSYMTSLAMMGSLMLLLDSHSLPLNPIRVALDLFNSELLISRCLLIVVTL